MNEIHISRQVEIDAPRDEVWAVLAQLDQISRWAPDVTHSSYTTEATEGIGAARRVQAGRQTLLETVTTWRAPGTLAYTLEGLPPVLGRVTNRWDLTVGQRGTTSAMLTSIIDPGTSKVGKALARVVIRLLAKADTSMLNGLAAYVAAQPRAAAPEEDA